MFRVQRPRAEPQTDGWAPPAAPSFGSPSGASVLLVLVDLAECTQHEYGKNMVELFPLGSVLTVSACTFVFQT